MIPKNENLVMIHGLLGSLSFFKPEKYFSKVNIFTPNLYCYGEEPCLENLLLEDQVEYLQKFIAKEVNEPTWVLGHSVGGALAMILAAKNPKKIKGVINVEGNFSLKDAFWTQKIANTKKEIWKGEYREIKDNPKKWLEDSNIKPTIEREKWAKEILDFQTAMSIQIIAKAVITDTNSKKYQDMLVTILKNDTPIHLIAGEHSKKDWDIPQIFLKSVASFTTIKDTGHMMMLEKPALFCEIVEDMVLSS